MLHLFFMYCHQGFKKPVLLFKTGTVAQKMTFVFLDLET